MQKNAARRQCLRAAAHSGHIGYRDRALIEKRGNDMKAGKPFIVYTVGVCLLALGGTILTVINFIDIIRFPPKEVDLTFIVASAFFIVGVGCLVLLIKKLFHWFYRKVFPMVDNAADLANGNVVSEKRAYRNLKIMTICIFLIVVILQLIVLLMRAVL